MISFCNVIFLPSKADRIRLELSTWDIVDFRSGMFAWELNRFRVGSFAWELSLGNFRLGSSACELSFASIRWGILAWDRLGRLGETQEIKLWKLLAGPRGTLVMLQYVCSGCLFRKVCPV